MTATLHQCQRNVVSWADDVFPQRTPKDILIKLFEETGEMIKRPTDVLEYADVMILLLDFAHHNGIDGNQIADAIVEKMEINKRRQWVVDRRTGIMQHA